MIRVAGKEPGVGRFVISTIETNPNAVKIEIFVPDRQPVIYAVNLIEALEVLKNIYGFFQKGMMNS